MIRPPQRPTLEVVLVTGFLGTGKTSLIRAGLEGDDLTRVGIIVNEAGDTDFDGIQIAQATGDRSAIRMLGNGCLCCEAADDLSESVRDLVERHVELTGQPTARVIIEASGLARPGRLLRQFRNLPEFAIKAHIVATVDATLLADPERHDEIYVQWSAANALVLTRADLAEDGGAFALEMAGRVNPLARILSTGSREQVARAALSVPEGEGELDLDSLDTASGHGAIRAVTFDQAATATWEECVEWLDNLSGIGGERVLRVKGRISPKDRPGSWLMQAVGTTFAHPVGVERTNTGHLVVIGEDLDSDWLGHVEPTSAFTRRNHASGSDHQHARH